MLLKIHHRKNHYYCLCSWSHDHNRIIGPWLRLANKSCFVCSVMTPMVRASCVRMRIRIRGYLNFDIRSISTEEVQEKPQHLNIYKSTGPGMLHPRILRALEDKLARPLTHIFNNSVETGIIPEGWESANVTAVHKKWIRQERGNYGPISHTSVVCNKVYRLREVDACSTQRKR